MNTYSSSNPVAMDSPFVKMLSTVPFVGTAPGIPPVPSMVSGQPSPLHLSAAKVLGLDSPYADFRAFRVRHLASILRNSRYSTSISWRSYLDQLDELLPIVDVATGLSNVTGAVSGFSYRLQRLTTPLSSDRLSWKVGVSGTSPNLSITVDGQLVGSLSAPNPSTAPLAVGTSGYGMAYSNSTPSGTPIDFSASLVLPYSGDCMPIVAAIRRNKDLVSALTAGKPDYAQAILGGLSVEDAISAFILAVEEA